MPLLLKNGRITEDPWVFETVSEQENTALPAPGTVLTLARWKSLAPAGKGYGVVLNPDDEVEELAASLDQLDLIAVNFPVFSDGRGFSHARLLRERYRFQGELRARGHLIRDQYLFLRRCGFDAIEVASSAATADWEAATREFTAFYQPATDDALPVYQLRKRMQAEG